MTYFKSVIKIKVINLGTMYQSKVNSTRSSRCLPNVGSPLNRDLSLQRLSHIARKDLEKKTNQGLLAFLGVQNQNVYNQLLKSGAKGSRISIGKLRVEKEQNQEMSGRREDQQQLCAISKEQNRKISNVNLQKQFRCSLVQRDQSLHPLKYKIVQQILGLPPQEIYLLKQAEISRAEQIYKHKKGLEYLKYSQKQHTRPFSPVSRVKTEEIPALHFKDHPQRSRDYVREIFRDVSLRNARDSERRLRYERRIGKLQQNEQILGNIVYHKVKKHLKSEGKNRDFSKYLQSQESIDDALINFLKVKIKKIEALSGPQ